MSLAKGDLLVIKRGDHIVAEWEESYIEFEVQDEPALAMLPPEGDVPARSVYQGVNLLVVK